MKKIFFVLACLSIALLFPSKTQAQTDSVFFFNLEPAHQEIILPEDQDSVSTSVTIKNETQAPQEIELFITEFSQTGLGGQVRFLAPGLDQNYLADPTSFISLSQDRTILEPNSSQTIEVYIEDRPNLSPGGHYFAVIARAVNNEAETNQQESDQQKVLPALSSLLLIHKEGGEIVNLSLKSIDFKDSLVKFQLPKTIKLLFGNEGNVHLIPRGTLTLKNSFGQVIAQGTVNEQSFYVLPSTQRKIPVQVRPAEFVFPVAFVTLEINGYSNIGAAEFFYETSFLYLNYLVLLVTALLLAGLWWWIRIRKRKKNHSY